MNDLSIRISTVKNYIKVGVFSGSKEISRKSIDINDGTLSAIDQTICVLGNTITDIVEVLKNEINTSVKLKQIFVIKDNGVVASFNFICTEKVQKFIDTKFTKLNNSEVTSHYYSDPYFITIKDKGIIIDPCNDKSIVADPKAVINLLSNYC